MYYIYIYKCIYIYIYIYIYVYIYIHIYAENANIFGFYMMTHTFYINDMPEKASMDILQGSIF